MRREEMKFAGKIWKAGNSNVITIPLDIMNYLNLKLDDLITIKLGFKKEDMEMINKKEKKNKVMEELPSLDD